MATSKLSKSKNSMQLEFKNIALQNSNFLFDYNVTGTNSLNTHFYLQVKIKYLW